ncbi:MULTISPECIES: ComF family protein [Glutamicibacter]|uniref:ComF family protein n=1 Tax=Glutamicibacter TaxID=1742989 RepID=UPI001958383F|nr:phosphoribosyltransferase family protein [Glutamicibacter nicotianae]MBM7768902.1 putative amidophosphoribosyltransferase [Glutamicibacter nicotianae]
MEIPQEYLRVLDELCGSRSMRWLGFGTREFANFLLPASCAVCGRADFRLCPECRSEIQRQLSLPPLPDNHHLYVELPALGLQLPVTSCGTYGKALARGLLAYKNKQRYFLGAVFAPYLAAALNAGCIPQRQNFPTLAVPVPSSLKATAQRGYSPVKTMLEHGQARGLLSADLKCRSLLHYRLGSALGGAQKTKSGSDRRGGQTHFVAERASTAGQPVILVDDVLTTGSTLRHAAMACHEAGYDVTCAVVLALTKPPNTGPEQ